jgi:hypothetical protein
MEGMRNSYKILGKSEPKRPLEHDRKPCGAIKDGIFLEC